jgi:activator of HSP90 ATPase
MKTWIAMENKCSEERESLITFRLSVKGEKSLITFVHENVPIAIAIKIVTSWKDYYWNPLKRYFSR